MLWFSRLQNSVVQFNYNIKVTVTVDPQPSLYVLPDPKYGFHQDVFVVNDIVDTFLQRLFIQVAASDFFYPTLLSLSLSFALGLIRHCH